MLFATAKWTWYNSPQIGLLHDTASGPRAVGPSGAGKDSVIAALAKARPDVVIARRIITRAADAGHEAHLAVSDAELAKGRTVIFNGSRRALPAIAAAYPHLRVLMVTAPADVLADRLQARGRENAEDIARRLRRADLKAPDGAELIVNDGPLEDAVAQVIALLTPPAESG